MHALRVTGMMWPSTFEKSQSMHRKNQVLPPSLIPGQSQCYACVHWRTDAFSFHADLIETATAELQVVAHIRREKFASKKGIVASPDSDLAALIPKLSSIVDKAQDSQQHEALQAQVCVAWIHWFLTESRQASASLPKNFAAMLDRFGENTALSPWITVCLVKGCYIRGMGW